MLLEHILLVLDVRSAGSRVTHEVAQFESAGAGFLTDCLGRPGSSGSGDIWVFCLQEWKMLWKSVGYVVQYLVFLQTVHRAEIWVLFECYKL